MPAGPEHRSELQDGLDEIAHIVLAWNTIDQEEMQILVGRLRMLVSARACLLVDCAGTDSHQRICLDPPQHWPEGFHALLHALPHCRAPSLLQADEAGEHLNSLLARMGIAHSLALPLSSAAGTEGALLLIEPADRLTEEDLQRFTLLGRVLGLVLHSSRVIRAQARELDERSDQLRDRAEEYRTLVENLPDVVARIDCEQRYRFVSPNVAWLYHMQEQDLLGRTPREAGLPEHICAIVAAGCHAVFVDGRPYETDCIFPTALGDYQLHWRMVPEYDTQGRVVSALGIARDNSAQRLAERQYQQLFTSMLDGFSLHEIICDDAGRPTDYRFLAVNQAFERMTGLVARNVVGRTVLEVLPETESYWIESFGRVALEGEPQRIDNYSQALDRHYHVLAYQPLPGQFACVFQDVTEGIRATAALQASEQRFRALSEASPTGIIETDQAGSIRLYNTRILELVGQLDLVDRHWLDLVHPDDQPDAGDNWQMALDCGRLGLDCRLQNTHTVHCLIEGRPLAPDADDSGWVLVFSDITPLKNLERERRQQQKLAALGGLAGGIAHDFNNVLQSILGYGKLVRRRLSDEQTAHYVDTILAAGERAAGLVSQILTFSRQGDHHPQPTAVDAMIDEVARFLASTLPASIRIELETAAAAEVMADATALHEILMNLAGNAVHAMRGQDGRLRLCSHRAGDRVLITVSDTGCGIPVAVRERIFEPFFTTKPVGEGTGMGLAVVHGLVHRMGGSITVTDNDRDARGTCFLIDLPMHLGLTTDEAMTGPALETPPSGPPGTGSGRILFVDDEALLVELADDCFRMAGLDAVCTVDVRSARSLILADPDAWSCVVTDQTMPHCTGLQLAREIKTLRADLPVVLCSGLSAEHWETDDGWPGPDEVIAKPYEFDELIQRLRAWLR